MKHLFLFVLFIICCCQVHAQAVEKHAFYTSGEFTLGNYGGVDMHLNYAYEENYSVKLGYSGYIRTPRSQPYNYSSGLIGALFLNLTNPYDQMENYQLLMGKMFPMNRKGTIRLNLAFGLGYTTIREPGNWERKNNGWISKNYTYEYQKYNTSSIIINPKIEFTLSRVYGFTLSPMLQMSKERTFVGLGIGQMIGLLRARKD